MDIVWGFLVLCAFGAIIWKVKSAFDKQAAADAKTRAENRFEEIVEDVDGRKRADLLDSLRPPTDSTDQPKRS